jgi:hypothetical protein
VTNCECPVTLTMCWSQREVCAYADLGEKENGLSLAPCQRHMPLTLLSLQKNARFWHVVTRVVIWKQLCSTVAEDGLV